MYAITGKSKRYIATLLTDPVDGEEDLVADADPVARLEFADLEELGELNLE